jgi:hypothetical protein
LLLNERHSTTVVFAVDDNIGDCFDLGVNAVNVLCRYLT